MSGVPDQGVLVRRSVVSDMKMKISAAALTPATRVCLNVAFGVHLPPDSILELDVYTSQDVLSDGITGVDAGRSLLVLEARVGERALRYGLIVPDGAIEKHVKDLLDESFLQLLIPEGISTPDVDALRRRLHFLRRE